MTSVYRKLSYVKTDMPVDDLEGKPFTCHICSKECTYAPLYTNVYVTWFVDCKHCYSVSEAGTLRSWLTLLLLLLTETVHKHITTVFHIEVSI